MGEHIMLVGASSPLATETARGFLARGDKLTLVARNDPVAPLGDFAKDGDVVGRLLDLHDIDSIHDFVAGICNDRGAIDRICFFQRYRDDVSNSWDGEYNVSLRATSRFIQEFLAQPTSPNDRSIVIVSSPADDRVVLEQSESYHAVKAGLSQLVRYHAMNGGALGFRVNGVKPAIVLKPRAQHFYDNHPDLVKLFNGVTPLGRMGQPADIANAVLFLSSPLASYITGQILSVDGGLSLHEAGSLARLAASLFNDSLLDSRWRPKSN